jgi:ribosomal protein L7/L12
MAKTATTRSEVLEQAYGSGLTTLIFAAIGLLGAVLLGYLFKLSISNPGLKSGMLALAGLGALVSLYYAFRGYSIMSKARGIASTTVNCPYCDYPMEFPERPTEDFDCEGCNRRVQFDNGRMVPIKIITCAFCKTVHKVSDKTTTYTCDRCNRTLKLTGRDKAVVAVDASSDLLKNYDVVLTDVGRNATEVAMELENILVCNLREARERMQTLPLTVMKNVPERKADAVRRRLRDLGATAVVKVTEAAEQPQRATRRS